MLLSTAYATLRSWYLARLRRAAIEAEQSASLTPAALIAADREVVEKLIAEKDSADRAKAAGAGVRPVAALRARTIAFMIALLILQLFCLALLGADGTGLLAGIIATDQVKNVLLCVLSASIVAMSAVFFFFEKNVSRNLEILANGESSPELEARNDELGKLSLRLSKLERDSMEASERENLIADYSFELICSIDQDGRVIAMSPSSYRLLGFAPNLLVGRLLETKLFSEDLEKYKNALNAARAGAPSSQVDLLFMIQSGELKYFHWEIEWSERSQIFFCTACDITVEKRLERAKEDFLSMTSHDLRSPVASVRTYLEVLESGAYGALSEKGQRMLKGAQDNLNHLIGLTDDLLDLDKLECGKMLLELNPVSVDWLINRAIASVQQFAELQKISIQVQESAGLNILGDSERLTQVLLNLLTNAIKYSPAGSPVQVKVIDLPGAVEIQVVDQGKGIPQAYQSLVFERYKQVSIADQKERKGAGLGLAIARGFIEAHHGEIGVRSTERQGSTFWFRLKKTQGNTAAGSENSGRAG